MNKTRVEYLAHNIAHFDPGISKIKNDDSKSKIHTANINLFRKRVKTAQCNLHI